MTQDKPTATARHPPAPTTRSWRRPPSPPHNGARPPSPAYRMPPQSSESVQCRASARQRQRSLLRAGYGRGASSSGSRFSVCRQRSSTLRMVPLSPPPNHRPKIHPSTRQSLPNPNEQKNGRGAWRRQGGGIGTTRTLACMFATLRLLEGLARRLQSSRPRARSRSSSPRSASSNPTSTPCTPKRPWPPAASGRRTKPSRPTSSPYP